MKYNNEKTEVDRSTVLQTLKITPKNNVILNFFESRSKCSLIKSIKTV